MAIETLDWKIRPIIERQPLSRAKLTDHPLMNRILQNRGLQSSDDLDLGIKGMLSPWSLQGMDAATDILIRHIQRGSRIVIVGDYDCDGATATSIAVEGLRLLGAAEVRFVVPDRMVHGYGLSPAIVQLVGRLEPDVIVTVDNGIASFAGCAEVKKLAKPCDLVITDHHLAAAEGLPVADAIVNPNQPGCPFPSKALAGCGVMFYVICALRAKMRDRGLFPDGAAPSLQSLLDLLALGTVADVVSLDRNNRILINAGLKHINGGFARPGIRHLLEIGKRTIGSIVAADMGFAVGPRLNAAGRLDDMTTGIRCLLERDDGLARALAEELDELNQQRREMEAEMVFEATVALSDRNNEERGLVVFDANWHEGVVGIVASRIKDKVHRPVICMTETEKCKEARHAYQAEQDPVKRKALFDVWQNAEIKGSARSVVGVHLKHVLDNINKMNPNVLTKFGGHAMAAGLSIRLKELETFRSLFNQEVSKSLLPEMLTGQVEVDLRDFPVDYISVEVADLIEKMGPWGAAFPEPCFHGRFDVMSRKILKDKHLKLVVKPVGSEMEVEAICFNVVVNGEIPVQNRFEGVFKLDVNEWRDNRRIQLVFDHVQDEGLILARDMAAQKPTGQLRLAGLAARRQDTDNFLETGT